MRRYKRITFYPVVVVLTGLLLSFDCLAEAPKNLTRSEMAIFALSDTNKTTRLMSLDYLKLNASSIDEKKISTFLKQADELEYITTIELLEKKCIPSKIITDMLLAELKNISKSSTKGRYTRRYLEHCGLQPNIAAFLKKNITQVASIDVHILNLQRSPELAKSVQELLALSPPELTPSIMTMISNQNDPSYFDRNLVSKFITSSNDDLLMRLA